MLKSERVKIERAKALPAGWEWHCYNDGSGFLANGKAWYFGYDMAPYMNISGIEYQKEKKSHYDIFWGSFQEFKKYAEEQLKFMLNLRSECCDRDCIFNTEGKCCNITNILENLTQERGTCNKAQIPFIRNDYM